jgi:GPI ethanolamine phosphate transferase 1
MIHWLYRRLILLFSDEKEQSELFFRPFQKLTGGNDPLLLVSEIQLLIDAGEFIRAEQKSKQLMSLSLQGLRYFQTYDWLFLRSIVTAGYIGWCVFCLLFVIHNYVLPSTTQYQISFKSRTTVSSIFVHKYMYLPHPFRLTFCH